MESDDFTRNYIIRYLSAHELVLPLNWDMYCSKTDWFQEISAWVAENGAMFTLVIYIVVLRNPGCGMFINPGHGMFINPCVMITASQKP